MNINELKICALSTTDLDSLTELFADYLVEFNLTHSRADIRRFLSDLLGASWVSGFAVFYNGEMIAFCLCTLNYAQVILAQALQIEDFFVAAPFRCKGVAAALLASIEEYARKAGVRRLFGLALPPEREYFRRAGWEPQEHTLMMRKLDG